jgi:hypothetical protein
MKEFKDMFWNPLLWGLAIMLVVLSCYGPYSMALP